MENLEKVSKKAILQGTSGWELIKKNQEDNQVEETVETKKQGWGDRVCGETSFNENRKLIHEGCGGKYKA